MSVSELSRIDANEVRGFAGNALDAVLDRYSFEDGAVLVQIPQVPPELVEHRIAKNRGYFAYPPQGLLYLGATFRDLGVPSTIVDLNYEVLRAAQVDGANLERAWQQALDDAVAKYEHPILCISFMFDPTYTQLTRVCRYLKSTHPDLAVIVGSVGATAEPQRVLKECGADLVVSNEGEIPLQQLYAYLRGESERVPTNLSYQDTNGDVVNTPLTSGGDVDLDIRDQYHKLGIEGYFKIGSLNNFSRMRGLDVPYATVLSRRGCRAHCTFCSVRSFNGRSVRVRESRNVVDEMEYLWNEFGIRHFEWLDDDLLYDRDEALRLFQEIHSRLPDASWCANNGLIAAAVTPEIFEAMVRSNCQGFTVGLETGNEEMLRKVRKPASLPRFARFAQLSKEYPQIFYIVNLILGLPEERFGQMLDTLAVSMRAKLDWNNFFNYQPLKNTDAFLAYGGLDDGAGADELKRRSTTMNYSPVRAGDFTRIREDDGIVTGFEILELDTHMVPSSEQMKEIWFTFNSLANFLRVPALFTDSSDRLRNAIQWLTALQTAYADNPSITSLLYYLMWRLDEAPKTEIEAMRVMAQEKFNRLEYWRHRDREFHFSALLDQTVPPIDPRATQFLADRGVIIGDQLSLPPH
jgi:radical SAM superfamily enzyme YgiQ (UPF0313 family)